MSLRNDDCGQRKFLGTGYPGSPGDLLLEQFCIYLYYIDVNSSIKIHFETITLSEIKQTIKLKFLWFLLY